jgi:hypothetical protein
MIVAAPVTTPAVRSKPSMIADHRRRALEDLAHA